MKSTSVTCTPDLHALQLRLLWNVSIIVVKVFPSGCCERTCGWPYLQLLERYYAMHQRFCSGIILTPYLQEENSINQYSLLVLVIIVTFVEYSHLESLKLMEKRQYTIDIGQLVVLICINVLLGRYQKCNPWQKHNCYNT